MLESFGDKTLLTRWMSAVPAAAKTPAALVDGSVVDELCTGPELALSAVVTFVVDFARPFLVPMALMFADGKIDTVVVDVSGDRHEP
jgi:hypothetical protein